jgi:hypothetical protein
MKQRATAEANNDMKAESGVKSPQNCNPVISMLCEETIRGRGGEASHHPAKKMTRVKAAIEDSRCGK